MSDNEDSDDGSVPEGQMENGYLPLEFNPDIEETDDAGPEDQFDVALPTSHRYLGKLENVSGYTVFDDNEIVTLAAIQTNTLVFPGFTLPLVINNDLVIDALKRHTSKSSSFVLLSPDAEFSDLFSYGVIMEIYETHLRDSILYLKAKCRQRCKLISNKDIRHLIGELYQATVKILPEPRITSPIENTQLFALKVKRPYKNISHSSSSSSNNNKEEFKRKTKKYRKYHLSQYPLANWIYDKYEIDFLVDKLIDGLLNYYLIEFIPIENPVKLSYWFIQNFQLKHKERLNLLKINSTIERLRLELRYLNMKRLICCLQCGSEIAKQSDVFAMSRDGVQSNYCNPGGHVFETVTVTHVTNFQLVGISSAQFSWFPGYSWTIIQCLMCNSHLGWRFTSHNLKPHCFYGLAKSGFDIKIVEEEESIYVC